MFDSIKTYSYLGMTCAYYPIDEDLSISVFFRSNKGATDSLVYSKSSKCYIRWSYNSLTVV